MTDNPRAPIDAADAVWPNVTLDRIDGVFVYADRGEPEPMTDEELAEIEARADAAAPPPWSPSDSEHMDDVPWSIRGEERHRIWWANRVFVAHARADIPRLLAEIRRLQAEAVKREEAHTMELIHQAAWS